MDNAIGLRITKIRIEEGLTQELFSKVLGIKQVELSHIENGGAVVSVDILNRLISNFDIDANWLLSGNGAMLRNEQSIGDILNSTVIGANVRGDGVSIHHTMPPETVDEILEKFNEIIEKLRTQTDKLTVIVNRLSSEVNANNEE